MPVIKDVEMYWVKLDPEYPVAKYLKKTMKEWSLEIRTPDRDVADVWEDEFHLRPKKIKDEDSGKTYYRAKLQKLAIANTEDPASKMSYPVEVVGPQLQAINPQTVGNGSIGDVMVSFRDWTFEGKKGITADLRKVRVKKLVEYYREFEEFDELDEELEIIDTVHDVKKKPKEAASKSSDDDEIYD